MELVDRNTISVANREIAEIGKEKERWRGVRWMILKRRTTLSHFAPPPAP